MTQHIPTAGQLLAFHDAHITDPQTALPDSDDALWHAVARNHRFNCLLWDEEDLARRRDVPDVEIAKNKRAIDGFNQARNDATETIDALLLAAWRDIARVDPCRLNSETCGMMIDRLSILALKIYHMRLQAQRSEAGIEHVRRCTGMLDLLRQQRHDLGLCLDGLIADILRGRAYFKTYRQFKMYNDPNLNPHLRGINVASGGTERST
jgi:hypothetical protein